MCISQCSKYPHITVRGTCQTSAHCLLRNMSSPRVQRSCFCLLKSAELFPNVATLFFCFSKQICSSGSHMPLWWADVPRMKIKKWYLWSPSSSRFAACFSYTIPPQPTTTKPAAPVLSTSLKTARLWLIWSYTHANWKATITENKV